MNKLSEYITDSILSKKSGIYGFPYEGLDLDNLTRVLEEKGYQKKQQLTGDGHGEDFLKTSYIGRNCWFRYRYRYEYSQYEILVSSENDKRHVLSFNVLPHGEIDIVSVLDENGKADVGNVYAVGDKDMEIGDLVKKFLGI